MEIRSFFGGIDKEGRTKIKIFFLAKQYKILTKKLCFFNYLSHPKLRKLLELKLELDGVKHKSVFSLTSRILGI